MELYSTNHKSPKVTLKEAVFRGLPEDGGLYLPTRIPKLPKNFIKGLKEYDQVEIAFRVCKNLMGDYIPEHALREILENALTFKAPLVSMQNGYHVLELFHGPTLAFKDFGGRFMSQLMSYFLQRDNREINILVATSGDTGSAVANGFLGVEEIKVTILYPKGKISNTQKKQITTLGQNINALEVDGTFDDCQALVKKAFLDKNLNRQLNLTSANSINISRLIPQSFYYFFAFAQLKGNRKPVFSVPSGNFGNLCGGILAHKMGLPVEKFIAATNSNDVFPRYLSSGEFHPKASKKTLANAMDVGDPSNFARIAELYQNNVGAMRRDIASYAFSDADIKSAIKEVAFNYEYTMCPHTATGYLGLKSFFSRKEANPGNGVILATAHPAKFQEIVLPLVQSDVVVPERLQKALQRDELFIPLRGDYKSLKDYLLS